ncbi:MAG: ATP synthase F1 subunit epsilon [Candidatus Omnitrophota bacterium]
MTSGLKLRIVTPDEVFYEGEVEYVQAPGAMGSLGILKDHAPLVTALTDGKLTVRDMEKQVNTYNIQNGFLEVLDNRVLVLSERVDR